MKKFLLIGIILISIVMFPSILSFSFAQFVGMGNGSTITHEEQLKLAKERLTASQHVSNQTKLVIGGPDDVMPRPSFWTLNPWAGWIVVAAVTILVVTVWKVFSTK